MIWKFSKYTVEKIRHVNILKCLTFYGMQLFRTTDHAPTKTKWYNLMVREDGCWLPTDQRSKPASQTSGKEHLQALGFCTEMRITSK